MSSTLPIALLSLGSVAIYWVFRNNFSAFVKEEEEQQDDETLDDEKIYPENVVLIKKPAVKKPPGDKSLNKKRIPRNIEQVLSESGKLELLHDQEKCIQYGKHVCSVLNERKFFDHKRYLCISRAQYRFSCGISSLTAVWNYLYTTLGNGSMFFFDSLY